MFADNNFYYGAAIMGVLMLVLMFYAAYWRADYLWQCFKQASPFKLGRHFYYIVSEHEWNQLLLGKLKSTQQVESERKSLTPLVAYTQRGTWNEYYCGQRGGKQCMSPDIREAKFYWNVTAAMFDQSYILASNLLGDGHVMFVEPLDRLKLDDAVFSAAMVLAHKQLNQEN